MLTTVKKISKGTKIAIAFFLVLAIAVVFAVNNIQNNTADKYDEIVRQLRQEAADARTEGEAKLQEQQANYESQLLSLQKAIDAYKKVSLDMIEYQIKEIGELATMEYNYTNANKFEESKPVVDMSVLKKITSTKSFIVKWDGTIKAGIDIADVKPELDEENCVVTIHMPKSKILSHEIDFEGAELLDEENGLWNKISVSDSISYIAKGQEAMEARAIENGVLDKADANAQQVLTQLLKPLLTSEYTINFVMEK